MQSEPRDARITVWALPRSLAATYGIDVSFSSSGYLDVSVPRVPFHKLWIHLWMTVVHTAGFPHSEISGSKDICSSPKLIAAYHVFHRLSVPRHPPCALLRLTFHPFFQNIWYPLDSLLLPTKIIVTLPFEIAIFLKRTYYNLCFAVIIQFSMYGHSLYRSLRFLTKSSSNSFPSPLRNFLFTFAGFPAGGLKWTRTNDL